MRKVLFTLALSVVLLTGGLQYAAAYSKACVNNCYGTYLSCNYSPEVCEAKYLICLERCRL